MYNYINQLRAVAKGQMKDPSFISINTAVIKNYSRIRERFVTTSAATTPNHILVKLLKSIALNLNDDYDSVYYRATDLISRVGNALRLTTPSSYGETFTGQFLKSGTEAILLHTDHFDTTVPWYDLQPITFLYHTNTNVNFQIGTPNDDSAIALVKINYAMLAYQFLQWAKWVRDNNVEMNTYHFLAKYAIYNSLQTYMDISQVNRHYYRFTDDVIPPEPKVTEYPVPNLEARIDRSNLTVVGFITNGATSTENTLLTVPVFFADTVFDLIQEPNMAFTRQVEWFQVAHVLPYLNFGFTASLATGSSKDIRIAANVKRELEVFNRTGTIKKLPTNIRVWLQTLIDDTIIKLEEYTN